MRITTKVYHISDKRICDMVLSKRLHLNDGEIQYCLHGRKNSTNKIAIAWHKGEPIGVAITTTSVSFFAKKCIMAYVRGKYKRQGIGSRLVKRLEPNGHKGWIESDTDKKRIDFWNKNGVKPHIIGQIK